MVNGKRIGKKINETKNWFLKRRTNLTKLKQTKKNDKKMPKNSEMKSEAFQPL